MTDSLQKKQHSQTTHGWITEKLKALDRNVSRLKELIIGLFIYIYATA
jgi:hypothetical protein